MPFLIPLILAGVLYAYLITNLARPTAISTAWPGVRGLFAVDGAVAGWLDRLPGLRLVNRRWQVRDAPLGIPHLLVVPCLICTLVVGPLGLALYFAVRGAITP